MSINIIDRIIYNDLRINEDVDEVFMEIYNELYDAWLKAGGFLYKIKNHLNDNEEKNKFKEDIVEVLRKFDISEKLTVNTKHQIEYELNKKFKEL